MPRDLLLIMHDQVDIYNVQFIWTDLPVINIYMCALWVRRSFGCLVKIVIDLRRFGCAEKCIYR